FSVLAGLATMFLYLWKTNETFRNSVINAWTQILSTFDKVSSSTQELARNLVPLMRSMKAGTINSFNKAMDWLGNSIQTVSDFLTRLKQSFDIKETLSTLIGPLTTLATMFLGLSSPIGWLIKGITLLTTSTSLFSDVLSVLKGEMSIGQLINNFATDLASLITNMAETSAVLITKGSEMIVGL